MNIKLVIFDCDGVLIDSEVIACRVDAEELTALGIPMTTEGVIRRFAGVSQKDMRGIIEDESGRTLPFDFDERVARRVWDAMSGELRAMLGVREMLAQLKVPFCIASSSTHEKLNYTLTLTGLYDLFAPNIFSSAEVLRGKPAPDLFLHAAGKMNVRPEHCLVVEDSTTGVKAATAAGMNIVGFVGGSHCLSSHDSRLLQAGASNVINKLDDLIRLL